MYYLYNQYGHPVSSFHQYILTRYINEVTLLYIYGCIYN